MVYVDQMRAPFGRMIMSHLVADSHAELIAMVDRIGVRRKWIQCEGTYKEHFDICASKRLRAISCGAQSVTQLELGRILCDKRKLTQK